MAAGRTCGRGFFGEAGAGGLDRGYGERLGPIEFVKNFAVLPAIPEKGVEPLAQRPERWTEREHNSN